MTHSEALKKSYELLSPFSDKQKWEFDNNLSHLKYITGYIKPKGRILDAGSGIGILTLALKLLGYEVEGVDKYVFEGHNAYFVEDQERLRAVWKNQNINILPTDLLKDTINEKFDVVISIAVIEHQKDPKVFLESILSALKSGGYLYLATPNVTHILNRIRFVFGRPPLGNLKDFYTAGENFTGHWREYSMRELKSFFLWQKLEVVFAKTEQSMKPTFKIKRPRDIYVNLLRVLGLVVPAWGEANLIIGKK
jgi:2-polyprenyl-3-methyl-5-hydroxy-6-metoxy-1,4-benzoquinol methylase